LERRLDGGGDELRGLRVDGEFRRSSMRRTTWPTWRGGSCGLSAMSAHFPEVVVDGGAVHADGLGDLGDA
jgi:hypothetical protein